MKSPLWRGEVELKASTESTHTDALKSGRIIICGPPVAAGRPNDAFANVLGQQGFARQEHGPCLAALLSGELPHASVFAGRTGSCLPALLSNGSGVWYRLRV